MAVEGAGAVAHMVVAVGKSHVATLSLEVKRTEPKSLVLYGRKIEAFL